MLAAEPDASGERREQLRLDAERSARTNVQYLDVTYSVQKSVSVLHVAFDRARVEAERAGRADEAGAWATHRDAVEAAIWAGNAAALVTCRTRPATPASVITAAPRGGGSTRTTGW